MAKLVLLLVLGLTSSCLCDQHMLLDTTKESMLDWTRYPYGPESPTPGWVEESFTNFEKSINWRSYVVCDVGYPSVNNWLWTPPITRHDAQRIYIEMKFSIRNCNLFPGIALQCKETFSLLYYEYEAASREPPPWEPESYKQIDVIAADEGRFTSNNEVIINTETRSIEVTKKGVYFAFRDQGACLSLLAVKVYYLKCPEITDNFAHFPETATGAQLTDIQKVSGTCVRHSSASAGEQPFNLCKVDGTWNFASGQCQCSPGYQPGGPEGVNKTCEACPIGQYKTKRGNTPCQICPPHSKALAPASTRCTCDQGYFRSVGDTPGMSCTRPPTAPLNLRYRLVDATTAVLSWEMPKDEGGRGDTTYSISCVKCPSRLQYQPASENLEQTTVQISGLYVGTTYTFRVLAENGVSSLAYDDPSLSRSYNEIRLMSESGSGGSSGGARSGLQSRVTGVRVLEARPSQVRLSWNPPPSDLLWEVEAYEVKSFPRDQPSNSSVVITKRDSAELSGLQPNTEYGFQVRVQTTQGWSDFSEVVYQATPRVGDSDSYLTAGGKGEDEGSSSVEWTVGVVCSLLLIFLVVLVVSVALKRRLLVSSQEKKEILQDSGLHYSGLDKTFMQDTKNQPIVHTHTAGALTLYKSFPSHKTYIDPHTYEDPNIAVKHFAKEIDPKYIVIQAIIGGGEFGDVCRGKLEVPGRTDMLVAIKTLKNGSSEKEKVDFLTEASIMGQFEHPNVIFLQGVVTKANPIMILTEYMENGSLDTFLRANDGKFQVMQLVGMMRGIAYGMQYLSEMNYVHRDLAARNVLVNSQLVCKIADFGLSREILEGNADGAYTTRGGKIPVRWTAPEAIAFRKFTSSSDVWSFGIVMWEVMSYGERPYWTWSNQEVIKHIEKGYRLPAPMDCPEAIHQLMLDTWQKERAHRPSFLSIVKTLDKLICCPETLKKIASSPSHHPFSQDAPDFSAYGSVAEWLAAIKMSRYEAAFAQAGVHTLDQVAKMSLQQLTDIGVSLVGHQKKIMNSIQAMRAQLSVNMSEGFLV